MYIKQIILHGFRSYRDQIKIEPFSPHHNVIVGRNGSGKSNFFYAIQFVLSDEFTNLNLAQRSTLLHEGTGPRVVNASVTIVFDNADNRLPIDKDEVVLERVVGSKKDQWFLDKKNVNRTEVMNLLESAGFSRSNPYYIVKQGKINELATAQDAYRLKLLREVAGTRVYDERKEESKTILKDTENKKEKIEELLKYIYERLHTLEAEKKELAEFQKHDKLRRSLEYTIYDHELRDTRKKLDELAEKKAKSQSEANLLHSQHQNCLDKVSRIQKQLKELKQTCAGLEQERSSLSEEQTQLFQEKTKMELTIKDLADDLKGERHSRKHAEEQLTQLREKIGEKQERLETVTKAYDDALKQEQDLSRDLGLAEQKKGDIYGRAGRKNKFQSKEERDTFLQKQIKILTRQIKETEARVQSLEADLAQDQAESTRREEEFTTLKNENALQYQSIETTNQQLSELKMARDKLQTEKSELLHEENNLTMKMSGLQSDINEAVGKMRTMMSRSTYQANQGVQKVLQHFREQGNRNDIVEGYYGTVIELFDCDPIFYTAVEVTAGQRLFNHVVSNDRVGTAILQEFNQQKLPGEVHFIPLNRVEAYEAADPGKQDASLLIKKLEFDETYAKAFRNIFGKTLVCRNMDVATKLARELGVDCITLEGDQISHKGALTGGYYDKAKSRLRAHKEKREKEAQLEVLKQKMDQHKQVQMKKDGEINRVMAEIVKKVSKLELDKGKYDKMQSDLAMVKEEIQRIQRSRQPKEQMLTSLRANLDTFRFTKESHDTEIQSEMLSQMSAAEEQELENLTVRIAQMQQQLKEMVHTRTKYERDKNRIENELNANLIRKRDELDAKLHEISMEDQKQQLDTYQSELKLVNERNTEISRRLASVNERLEEFNSRKQELSRTLEQTQNEQKDAEFKLAEDGKELEKMASKIGVLQRKKGDCLKKISDIGTLPTDALDKYLNLPLKQLFKKLETCNKELKKYGNVNKKAMDQYIQFSEQKEKLTKRQEELEKGYESILELMKVLEQRKSEAIEFTFKQVAGYFEEVFKKLVPQGCGKLVMKTGDSEDGSSVEQYTGIQIKVSFSGTDETKEMQMLSGGQKSLVALAMIFAIQRCDPAPFYLFDEIDAALDAQHRKAVADMIHELSKNAQFITTTFRPELLDHADKFYGVRFINKVSHIYTVSKEEARDFVEDDATHG